jgi:hypothetical protein
MRRKSKAYENTSVEARVSGAENVDVSEVQETAKSFTNKSAKKIIKFPEEFIKRTQYEFKKTYRNADDFQRIFFVSRALSNDKDEIRLYKTFVKIETDAASGRTIIVATDGRRLHLAEINIDIPEGHYNIRTKNNVITFQEVLEPADGFNYPDYRKLIIDPEELTKVCDLDLTQTSLTKNLVKTGEISKQFAKIVRRAEKVMNIRFLDDLAKLSWELYIENNKNGALHFKLNSEKELLALIMPLDASDD